MSVEEILLTVTSAYYPGPLS